MKLHYQQTNDSSNMLLYGAVMFAGMNTSNLIEYAVKAMIGGMVWLAFKIIADRIAGKQKRKK